MVNIRSKHIGRDIAAGFKNIVGGELKGYTELLQEAREQATQRQSGRTATPKIPEALRTGGTTSGN